MQHDNILKKLISYKPIWPLLRGHFWLYEHYLNKLGRRPLGDATYGISRLYALLFKTKKISSRFPICAYVKHMTPGLLGDALNQLLRVICLVVLDKQIFSCFPYLSHCKTCDPRFELIFGPRSII